MTPRATMPSRIEVGTQITPYQVRPSSIQLFRFSAATWNAHRIHYDAAYAQTEGYRGVVVQSHLHGCFLADAVLTWAGANARLEALSWKNRAPAIAGDLLTVTGSVTGIDGEGHYTVLDVALEEHDQDGALCAPGTARVAIPSKVLQ